MKKIYSELSRIQQELKAPKNLYNKFGNYNYRNAESILEAVKPLLNGLVLLINDEPVVIGARFYIKATVTLTDGEESVSAIAYAREDETKKGMDGCQVTGACSSYARKYALNALLMIDDSKDSDDDSLSPKNPKNNEEEQKPKNQPQNTAQNAPQRTTVTTGATVPPIAQNAPQAAPAAPQKPPMSEGAAFLVAEKAKLEQELGEGFNFGKARLELIANGKVESVPSATITLLQAQTLIKVMRETYGKKAS